MSADWKPGDVAVVTGRWQLGEDHTARRAYREGGCWTECDGHRSLCDWEVSDTRPLVVIDPKDREQVQRLADCYVDANPGVASIGSVVRKRIKNALREFARSETQQLSEPPGLGAVVEDANGRRWVNVPGIGGVNGANWVDQCQFENPWSDINAVRVLSEGVPTTEETPA